MRRTGRSLLLMALLLGIAGAAPAAFKPSTRRSAEEIRSRLATLPADGHEAAKGQLYADLGTVLYNSGLMTQAAEAFEESLEHKTSRSMRRYLYLYLGKCYEAAQRLDKAIPAYEQAVVYDPKHWRRHRDLGTLYEQAKLYRKAIDSYNEAQKLKPKESSVYFARGRCWRKMGLYRYAEDDIDKALAFGHDPNAVEEERSYIFEGEGRLEAAADAMGKTVGDLTTAPDWARLIYLAGLAGDKGLATKGLAGLKASNPGGETTRFYENLVEWLFSKADTFPNGTVKDDTLRAMIDAALAEPAGP